MRIGLRTKLIALIIGTCLVTSVVFAGVVYSQLQQVFKSTTQEEIKKNVSLIAEQMDLWSTEVSLAAETAAMEFSHLIDAPDKLLHSLTLIQKTWKADVVFWVTPDGFTNINTFGAPVDLSDRPYIQNALAGRISHSGAVISRTTSNVIISAAAPVRNEDGEIIGAIGISRDLEVGVGSFVNLATYASEDTYLFNADGLFLTSSRFDSNAKLTTRLSNNPIKAFAGEPFSSGIYLDYRGIEVIGAWHLSDYGWAIVTEVDSSEILAPLHNLLLNLFLTLLGIIAVLSVLAIYFSPSITRPIQMLVLVANRIAEGNLSLSNKVENKSHDEIGQLAKAIYSMQDNMRTMIGKVKESADDLAERAGSISISSNEVAASNSEQANIAQEVTRAINELSRATEAIASSTSSVSQAGDVSYKTAKSGSDSIRESIGTMDNIKIAVNQLGLSSKRIGDILNTISDIADQTNLLALNAAIEAARAGEHGKSFTVVAEAVRSLAEKASSSTKEIAELVSTTQEQIGEAIETTEIGTKRASNAISALDIIVNQIQGMVSEISDISAAGEEQAATAEEVMASMESLSAASEQVSASSQEAAGSAKVLTKMSDDLRALVANFMMD